MLKYLFVLILAVCVYSNDTPKLTSDLSHVFKYNHLDLGSFEYVYGRAPDKIQKIIKDKSLLTGAVTLRIVTISTYHFQYESHGDITIKILSEDNTINEIAVKIDNIWKTWY